MLKFVDEATITVSSGKGGNGCVAFRREKYVPKGGPAGGDGGRGGDLIFQIKQDLRTLVHLRYKKTFKAKNGQDGQGRQKHGSDGEDCIVFLPPGCTLKDAETGELVYDFGDADEGTFLFLKGGNGGWGNCHFKSSTNQAPQTALKGQEGETRKLLVELSIIADLGFVGFPNAGKSSLLDYYTNARPKIAPYPFTTKIPNLGVLRVDEERDIILADIPGILEGASTGYGLGTRFLKHIERTSGLVFLIDLSNDDYLKAYSILEKELVSYSDSLKTRPRIVVGTKLDLPETAERLKKLQANFINTDIRVLGVSVFNRWGLDELKKTMVELLEAEEKKHQEKDKRISIDGSGKISIVNMFEEEKNFMEQDLGEDYFDERFTDKADGEHFGATVSLSRKRRPKK
ncbi:MAG: GTPase ObgE [Treponemataceae bacterium]